MSVETSVYTSEAPLAAADIVALAGKKKLELRFVIPFKCLGLDQRSLEEPLRKEDLMVYCWPAADRSTTRVLDNALAEGDQALILVVQDKFGWFDFRCEKYDYGKSWKRYPGERRAFEASVSRATLDAMRLAKVRYFFRCGLRPDRNAKYLGKIARLVRDATNGHLGE
jgi:hypothetical protein